MGIIHDNRERLPFVDALHASRYAAHSRQRAGDDRGRDALTPGSRDGRQAVTDIEKSHQLGFNLDLSAGHDGAKARTPGVEPHINCANSRRLIDSIVKDWHTTVRPHYIIRRIITV